MEHLQPKQFVSAPMMVCKTFFTPLGLSLGALDYLKWLADWESSMSSKGALLPYRLRELDYQKELTNAKLITATSRLNIKGWRLAYELATTKGEKTNG